MNIENRSSDEMNPEDRHQLDSLAGKLAALQPSSASGLEAETFYRAGEQAAKSRHKTTGIPSWFARVSVAALMLLSSSAAYYAGISRVGISQVGTSRVRTSQGAVSQAKALQSGDTTERASQPKNAPVERGDLGEPARVGGLALESGAESRSSSFMVAAAGQSKLLFIPSWLQFPELSPEKYAQMVEARTAPARVKYTVKQPRETVKPIDSLLDELQGESPDSLLRRWLSM